MRIKVADFVFEIDNRYSYSEKFTGAYLTEEEPDCYISVPQEVLEKRRAERLSDYPLPYIEFLEIYRRICDYVIANGGILMHGAVIEYDSNAYMFTAPSGTGKTTHIRQWKKLYGDKVQIVNGDKPLMRYIDGEFMVYGTPWCGKEHYNRNVKVPLKGIVLVARGEENVIKRISPDQFNQFLVRQVYLPKNPEGILKSLDFADRLFTTVPLYRLECNISVHAARVACEEITKN